MLTRRELLGVVAGGAAMGVSTHARSPQAGAPAGQRAQTPRSAGAPSLSRQFGRWAAGLSYADLPAPVVDRAKGLTLQALASVLLGSQTAAGRQAIKLVVDE